MFGLLLAGHWELGLYPSGAIDPHNYPDGQFPAGARCPWSQGEDYYVADCGFNEEWQYRWIENDRRRDDPTGWSHPGGDTETLRGLDR